HMCNFLLQSSCSDLLSLLFFFLMLRPPPTSTLFPYTTLFRSLHIHTLPTSSHPPQAPPSSSCNGSRYSRCPSQIIPRLKKKAARSEEHTSELQSRFDLVCRLLLEKKNQTGDEFAEGAFGDLEQ